MHFNEVKLKHNSIQRGGTLSGFNVVFQDEHKREVTLMLRKQKGRKDGRLAAVANLGSYKVDSEEYFGLITLFQHQATQNFKGVLFHKLSGERYTFEGENDNFGRKLQTAEEILGKTDQIVFWEDCFPENIEEHMLDIGVTADLSFFNSFEEDKRTQSLDLIEHYIEYTNVVYRHQFNMTLRLRQVILLGDDEPKSKSSTVDFLYECPEDAGDLLSKFSSFVSRFSANGGALKTVYPVQQGFWHEVTSCFTSNTVGLGYVTDPDSDLCSEQTLGENTAFSAKTSRNFLLFAHEMGHNIGGSHQENDSGGVSSVGVMGYGNGRSGNAVQFVDANREAICDVLTSLKTTPSCNNFVHKKTDLIEDYGESYLNYTVIESVDVVTTNLNALADGSGGDVFFLLTLVFGIGFFSTAGYYMKRRQMRKTRELERQRETREVSVAKEEESMEEVIEVKALEERSEDEVKEEKENLEA
eukprot:augustus_masked-scaffold_9-processed-gene-1.43-mRNA-1 protein AED:0.28 eAED:0.32 QI:0/-1/0/1/-1/1/1/0/469